MGQSLFNVGRRLTPEEWGELKAWRAANPDLRWKRGDRRIDGKVFVKYNHPSAEGEWWSSDGVLAKARANRQPQNSEAQLAARRARHALCAARKSEARREKYAANPDKARQESAAWKRENRGHYRARYHTDSVFRLTCRCRARVRAALRAARYSKSEATAALIGCSWAELRSRLESLFTAGMGWHNAHLWHVDHIVPCASAKTEPELRALFHYSNLQPLWAADNLRKSDKLSHELPG